ncbi:MAG: M48 family metallopeptidase [Shimia sp.]
MAEVIELPGVPPVIVTRPANARRMTLRVARQGGEVRLSLPRSVSRREAEAFVEDRRAWITAQVSAAAPDRRVHVGMAFPLKGRAVRLAEGGGRGIRLEGDHLYGPHEIARPLASWLKALARDQLAVRSDLHAARLGVSYTKLTLRDTRSRWGSCTSAGGLMYSWRLIMAPPEILDYVAAHEVSHLLEMNHSPRFWGHVARLMPDYEVHRAWLRRHGADLQSYRFD